MLYEALTRRLRRGLKKGDLPDLLIVDGGKGQLNVPVAACRDVGVPTGGDALWLAGTAKARTLDERKAARMGTGTGQGGDELLDGEEVQRSAERLFLPNAKDPLALKPHSAERFLVEQVRDEAHRFAITAHRNRSRLTGWALDPILTDSQSGDR